MLLFYSLTPLDKLNGLHSTFNLSSVLIFKVQHIINFRAFEESRHSFHYVFFLGCFATGIDFFANIQVLIQYAYIFYSTHHLHYSYIVRCTVFSYRKCANYEYIISNSLQVSLTPDDGLGRNITFQISQRTKALNWTFYWMSQLIYSAIPYI